MASEWVIEHEGYLLKRGAGFQKNAPEKNFSLAQAQALSQPKNSGLGKAERKRYFILKSKKSKTVKVANSEKDDTYEPEEAILLYYGRNPEGQRIKPKGKITLKGNFSVSIQDGIHVELATGSRTYYLRPTSDMTDTEARVIAGQWSSAVEFAIKRVKTSEEYAISKGITIGSKKGGYSSRTLMKIARAGSFKGGRAERGESLVSYEGSIDGTEYAPTEKVSRGKPEDYGDGSYKSVWSLWSEKEAQKKLDGYHALIAHFGPVQTDLARLHAHVENRIQLVSDQIEVLENHAKTATEPTIKVQKTTHKALQKVYDGNIKRLDRLAEIFNELQTDVKTPLDNLRANLKMNLEKEVKYAAHHSIESLTIVSKAVTHLYQEYSEKKKYYEKKKGQGNYEDGADNSEEEEDNHRAPRPSLSNIRRKTSRNMEKFKVTFGKISRITKGTSSHSLLDDSLSSMSLDELEDNVEASKESYESKLKHFLKLIDNGDKPMLRVMKKLEDFERDRLQTMKAVAVKLCEIETKMFTMMFQETSLDTLSGGDTLYKNALRIDPEQDMKFTADALLQTAKKMAKNGEKEVRNRKPKNQLEE